MPFSANAILRSTPGSLYQPGQAIQSPKLDKETPAAHDERCWKERGHYLPDGRMIIPAVALKRCLDRAAAYNPKKLRGNATYTKLFESSVIVLDPIVLPETRDTVEGVSLFLPADGKSSDKSSGSSTRVWRKFPTVRSWEGVATFHVLDDRIDEATFRSTLKDAGLFVGLGTWAPRARGLNGRFEVVDMEWSEV